MAISGVSEIHAEVADGAGVSADREVYLTGGKGGYGSCNEFGGGEGMFSNQ